jgi:hypothetical protein
VKFPLFPAAVTALALLLGACGDKGSSADPPANFKATAADASVILTWTAEPGVDYWIFYAPGESITTVNWALSGGSVITKATSPATIGGLTNGRTYSFTINGRKDGGPGGPGAPTQVAVPRLSGTVWTVGTPLGTGSLTGAVYGNIATGYADVVVGAGGTLYSGINGAALAPVTNPVASADLNAVWYSTLGFVAAGTNGTLLYSVDATTWTAQASNTTATLHAGANAGIGGFVAVGAAGTILLSSNGADWIAAASGTTNHLYGATFGNGRYVVVGANGTILTTIDGTTWTAGTSGTARDLRSVAYAALVDADSNVVFRYVAVGAGGTILTSIDGTTWTAQATVTTNDLTAITFGGQFVAVGKGGVILTSLDGLAWETRTSGTTNDLLAVTRTVSGYTAVGTSGTNVTSF